MAIQTLPVHSSNNEGGFSLIELMVVVAIISVLVTMGGPSMQEAGDHMKIGLAKATMNDMKRNLVGLRAADGDSTIPVLTANVGGNGSLFANMGIGVGNHVPHTTVFPAMVMAQWNVLGYSSPPKDPWGNYYVFDQNDEEFGPLDTRCDIIYSAGPDGIWDGVGDQTNIIPVGDDIMVGIPKLNFPNAKCTL